MASMEPEADYGYGHGKGPTRHDPQRSFGQKVPRYPMEQPEVPDEYVGGKLRPHFPVKEEPWDSTASMAAQPAPPASFSPSPSPSLSSESRVSHSSPYSTPSPSHSASLTPPVSDLSPHIAPAPASVSPNRLPLGHLSPQTSSPAMTASPLSRSSSASPLPLPPPSADSSASSSTPHPQASHSFDPRFSKPVCTLQCVPQCFSECQESRQSCPVCAKSHQNPVYTTNVKDWIVHVSFDAATQALCTDSQKLAVCLSFNQISDAEENLVQWRTSRSAVNINSDKQDAAASALSGASVPAQYIFVYQPGQEAVVDFVSVYSNARAAADAKRGKGGKRSVKSRTKKPKRVPCPVMPLARLHVAYAWIIGDEEPEDLSALEFHTIYSSHIVRTVSKPRDRRVSQRYGGKSDSEEEADSSPVKEEESTTRKRSPSRSVSRGAAGVKRRSRSCSRSVARDPSAVAAATFAQSQHRDIQPEDENVKEDAKAKGKEKEKKGEASDAPEHESDDEWMHEGDDDDEYVPLSQRRKSRARPQASHARTRSQDPNASSASTSPQSLRLPSPTSLSLAVGSSSSHDEKDNHAPHREPVKSQRIVRSRSKNALNELESAHANRLKRHNEVELRRRRRLNEQFQALSSTLASIQLEEASSRTPAITAPSSEPDASPLKLEPPERSSAPSSPTSSSSSSVLAAHTKLSQSQILHSAATTLASQKSQIERMRDEFKKLQQHHDVLSQVLQVERTYNSSAGLFNSSAIPLAMVSTVTSRVTSANRKMLDLTGFSPDEIVELPPLGLVPPSERSTVAEVVSRVQNLALEYLVGTCNLLLKSGDTISVAYTLSYHDTPKPSLLLRVYPEQDGKLLALVPSSSLINAESKGH